MRQLHRTLLLAAALLLLASAAGFGQMNRQDSIWLPFKPFIGTWSGTGGGETGTGTYERTYQPVLKKRFIEVRNKSTYPPTEKNPNGEVHEDWGLISYDKARKTFVLRQFHVEGFVNQYRMDSISADGKRIVFTSEAIENIPQGFRARETYDILSDTQIRETFELAEPGKEFTVYTSVVLNRVQ